MNGLNGVLFYDNAETTVENRFKLDITTAEEEYIIWHEGNFTPADKADIVHTHVEADITDLDKYTQTEVDNLLLERVSKSGDSMTGDLTIDSGSASSLILISDTNLTTRLSMQDDGNFVFYDENNTSLGSITRSGHFTSPNQPTADNHLTRKDYVDSELEEKVSSIQEQGVGNKVTNMIYLTESEYNTIPHLPDTLYFITNN
jgi:hypothetical protein